MQVSPKSAEALTAWTPADSLFILLRWAEVPADLAGLGALSKRLEECREGLLGKFQKSPVFLGGNAALKLVFGRAQTALGHVTTLHLAYRSFPEVGGNKGDPIQGQVKSATMGTEKNLVNHLAELIQLGEKSGGHEKAKPPTPTVEKVCGWKFKRAEDPPRQDLGKHLHIEAARPQHRGGAPGISQGIDEVLDPRDIALHKHRDLRALRPVFRREAPQGLKEGAKFLFLPCVSFVDTNGDGGGGAKMIIKGNIGNVVIKRGGNTPAIAQK